MIDPIVVWLENLLELVLKGTSLPAWLVAMIINFVKSHLTADIVKALEAQVACYVCAKAKLLIGPTPTPAEASFLAMLENLLGCANCAAAAPAPIAAP